MNYSLYIRHKLFLHCFLEEKISKNYLIENLFESLRVQGIISMSVYCLIGMGIWYLGYA